MVVAVKPIAIEEFLEEVGNIYEAIIVAAKRARQIHDDTKLEFNQRLETLKALSNLPETEDEADAIINPDQLKLSIEFEKRPKPVDVSLKELKEKKVAHRYKETVNPFTKDIQVES